MKLFLILTFFAAVSVEMAFSRRGSSRSRQPSRRSTDDETCLSGDGSSYRGIVSRSASGRPCMRWNSRYLRHSPVTWPHNYCRNPDASPLPWCAVRRGRRIVREFCDIPKCAATVRPPAAADTELTCGERPVRRLNKIVGGSITAVESQPWVAAIYRGPSAFLCGGTLIAPCWVLTAAHCFPDGSETNIRRLSVFLGKDAINETNAEKEQVFGVERLVVHQDYNESNYNNDIALLKIKTRDGRCAVQSASARTACLPPPHTRLPAGFECSIAGYGKDRYDAWRYSQYLKQGQVKLLPQAECRSKPQYGDLLTDNMFCAASPEWNTDACKGDSGGPMVCEVSGRMFLFGVVSWGIECAQRDKPGVYTQVTNYNQWIADKTQLPRYTAGVMYPEK